MGIRREKVWIIFCPHLHIPFLYTTILIKKFQNWMNYNGLGCSAEPFIQLGHRDFYAHGPAVRADIRYFCRKELVKQ